MFGKNKNEDAPPAIDEVIEGKGHATPKRKDQEAARKRPFIADPKADRAQRSAARREQREKENAALMSGDERHMPAEHRGPDRKFLRDYVDARTSIGEYLLPIALLFVILSLAFNANTTVGTAIVGSFYALVLLAVAETIFAVRKMGRLMRESVGAAKVRSGWQMYAIARMFNLRRLRVPRPVVKRGEFPL